MADHPNQQYWLGCVTAVSSLIILNWNKSVVEPDEMLVECPWYLTLLQAHDPRVTIHYQNTLLRNHQDYDIINDAMIHGHGSDSLPIKAIVIGRRRS